MATLSACTENSRESAPPPTGADNLPTTTTAPPAGPGATTPADPGAPSETAEPDAADFSFMRLTEDNDEELIDISYPVLRSPTSPEAAPVNDRIIKAVDDMVVDFMDAAAAAPPGESRSTLTLQAAPELISNEVFSVSGVFFEFVRGAAPTTKRVAWIFSLETKSLVAPAELFIDGSLEHLAAAAADHLAADILGDAAAITAPEGLEPTPANFDAVWLTTTGIGVGFDQYQVTSGDAGSPAVFIPFSELLDVLDKTGILTPLQTGSTLPGV
jgi:hypothetical protein